MAKKLIIIMLAICAVVSIGVWSSISYENTLRCEYLRGRVEGEQWGFKKGRLFQIEREIDILDSMRVVHELEEKQELQKYGK